jgi:hypothetical protein
MGVRGRKSAASQQTVVAGNFDKRPDPPNEITEAQADVWRETVASENADFFKTAALRSMLVDYCRHKVTSDVLSRQLDAMDPESIEDDEGLKRYEILCRLRERETKAAADKATKLRLTNQSRYVPHTANTAAKNSGSTRPWEVAA